MTDPAAPGADTDRYIDQLLRDGDAMLGAARTAGAKAPVPTCPGWTVRDLMAHTAQVYRHKALVVEGRLQSRPPDDSEQLGTNPWSDFQASLDRVVAALRAADPAERVWTWFPPSQDVAFWRRRMCQETVIHRADAEVAAAGVPQVVPAWLALDGVDELLVCFVDDDWTEQPTGDLTYQVAVRSDGRSWLVDVAPTLVTTRADPDETATADVTVTAASASELLLGLWHRLPADVLRQDGPAHLVAGWHRILAVAE